MGSMIELSVGELDIDTGKNAFFSDHSPLFQVTDIAQISYIYVGEDNVYLTEWKEGYSRKLEHVLPRLDLLGFPPDSQQVWFDTFVADCSEEISRYEDDDYLAGIAADRRMLLDKITLETVRQAFRTITIKPRSDKTVFVHEEYLSSEEILAKALGDTPIIRDSFGEEDDIRPNLRHLVQSMHPWVLLRFIAENPVHLTLDVKWGFNDVVEDGWVTKENIVKPLSIDQQFLIVTEGSSDTSIISHSLQILRPDIADFFRFVDMSESYPFSGIGNLHNFCKGLICIGHSHPTVFIYDNDTEGTEKLIETQKLNLLPDMRVIKLPDLAVFEHFSCVGPNGASQQNINGKAAAIECYLDLRAKQPTVRWTAYNSKAREYQGILEDKGLYAKRFYSVIAEDTGYDFSKLDIVLDYVVSVCTGIKSVDIAWDNED